MKNLVRLAISVIGLTAPVAAYSAPVIWSFYETGITSCNSPSPFSCVLPPQPFVLATLVLPGPTSAGTAIWDRVSPPVYTGDNFTLSRQSRNQTGGRRQDSSSAVRAILDDPPIHIRPVCSRKRGCEGQEPCGFNAFQHAHGCTPPPPRPQDSSHVLSRVSS